MNVPGFDHAGKHLRMAPLTEALAKERVVDADDLLKPAAVVGVAHQRLDHHSLDRPHPHRSYSCLTGRHALARPLWPWVTRVRTWRPATLCGRAARQQARLRTYALPAPGRVDRRAGRRHPAATLMITHRDVLIGRHRRQREH